MKTLDDLIKVGVAGRRVLVRSDLNVPLKDGVVGDDGRIRASLPVLTRLLDHGARVIVTAHLGRPKGAPDPAYSLRPVADRLAQLLGRPVEFALDTVGESARLLAGDLADGELLLLENVRFNAGETSKDDAQRAEFARCLALLTGGEEEGGAFVEDAFGAVHRKHASVYDVARLLPHYCGDLVRDELTVLRRLTGDTARPYVVVLGGSKVSDKLAVIESLLPRVDRLLVGGGMCFTFLAAQGYEVGDSLLEADQLDNCRRFLQGGAETGDKIVLPTDVVVATEITPDAATQVVAADAIPAGTKGLDIGPESVRAFAAALDGAQTVFWNGPMGVFEVAPFAAGTKGVAQAVADISGLSVVGGGDSAAAVRALGLDENAFGHISTGGGASLEYLEGKELPGVAVLEEV